MPAKGTTLVKPNRDGIISERDFCKRLRKETGLKISERNIRRIIHQSGKQICNAVLDDKFGFKLPHGMGYLAVTKFKPARKKAINWPMSNKFKKLIYHINAHSFGYAYRIFWFKTRIARFKYNEVYKFEPGRILKRMLSARIKEGADYEKLEKYHFWDQNRIEKNLHKLYKYGSY